MYSLPDLPYDYDALDPFIDGQTMRFHHDKHHAAYVKNLNSVLEKLPDFANTDIIELISNLATIPQPVRTAVVNNGGGHLNHSLFWKWMTPEKTSPAGKLLTALEQSFGSLDGFRDQFSTAALSQFGSGWAWLVNKDGKLSLTATSNQDSPYSKGEIPLLGLDVWEHAYYLQYKNVRADYISNWWHVVNWDEVSSRYLDSLAI